MKLSKIIEILAIIFLILFGIFMAYQVVRVILGGSWTVEDILISLIGMVITALFAIVGFLVSMSRTLGMIERDLVNLKGSFCNLAKDFKQHLSG
jgi:hypothetical protein